MFYKMLSTFYFYALCCIASCCLVASTPLVYSSANLLPLPRLPLLKSTVELHEPALAKVGELVEHVPTAVSHQSSTIVHSHEPRVSPILAPATAVHSYAAPTYFATSPVLESRSYHLGPAASFVHAHAPYVWPQALLRYAASPFI